MSITNKKIRRLPTLITRTLSTFPGLNQKLSFARAISLKTISILKEEKKKEFILLSQINSATEILKSDNFLRTGYLCQAKTIHFQKEKVSIDFDIVTRVQVINFHLEKNIYFVDYVLKPLKSITKVEHKALSNKIKQFFHLSSAVKGNESKLSIIPLITLKTLFYNALKTAPESANLIKIKAFESNSLFEGFQILFNSSLFHMKKRAQSTPKNEIDKEIDKRMKNRLSKQQRDYYLREKMREIKEELGEISKGQSDLDVYRSNLNKHSFPVSVKKRILSEINRYESLPMSSPEANVTKNYIEWMMKIPWHQKSKETDNLETTLKVLDKNHFGLKKAKRRIVEHLAAAIFSKKSSRGQIICLVGPPGVGKTSLGISIAAALQRKYVRIALGGVKDEAEIRGHRRTYIGSMPGKIIQALKKAQTVNPLILIDEIDKMGNDFRGDPANAMLEVLDPEQNHEFADHYIEEPYDLSAVLFIATANYEGDIPPALYDRMEIINLSSYTEMEKLKIATLHLLPKIFKEQSLTKKQLKFHNSAIQEIIKHYTRESGVRELNRLLSQICRRFIVRLLKKEITSEIITTKNVINYLEKRLYVHHSKNTKSQIGIATGLAYTSFGGDILPIETTKFPGKGRLILTGKLGEILRESANIAFDYIKSNHKSFGIKFSIFEENDFHIHLPEGAVPKDGPSAGTALTTALISLLTKRPVPREVGMTGEITLHGKILQIGGLTEKSIAAVRGGLAKIFIPKENEKDLEDIPNEVKNKIKIVLVSEYKEIYREIFPPKLLMEK